MGIKSEKQRVVVRLGVVPWQIVTEASLQNSFPDHVAALARLKEEGHEVVLITSGAVAAGFSALGYPSRPVTIKGKQAAAAVGQSLLMQAYTENSVNMASLLRNFADEGDFSRKNNIVMLTLR